MQNIEKHKKALNIIKQSQNILIAGHTSPDGDSIGSCLALKRAIEDNLGKKSIFYCADEVPQYLNFLPQAELAQNSTTWYPDLIIGVDYSSFDRLGIDTELEQGAQIITFDHHPPQNQKGDVQIIDISYSSTCELIYDFLKAIEWKISAQTAQCLLTGIITDTGAFAHNTSDRTFKITGNLIKTGVDIKAIYNNTFAGKKDKKTLNAWGYILGNMSVNNQLNYAAAYVPFKNFIEYGIIMEDLTGLVNILNASADTGFSVLVTEYESGKIKGSLRSDKFKDVDVSAIAKQLGGGGHKYASGFSLECSLEEARRQIESAIKSSVLQKVKI